MQYLVNSSSTSGGSSSWAGAATRAPCECRCQPGASRSPVHTAGPHLFSLTRLLARVIAICGRQDRAAAYSGACHLTFALAAWLCLCGGTAGSLP